MSESTRGCGILLHISSLPSDYGIGTFGEEAYKFVDFLKESGQKYWQILPLGQTSYGDSPYQSFSIYAGNPYFIDLDILNKKGLLKDYEYKNINFGADILNVDYEVLFNERYKILKKAFKRFNRDDTSYLKFKKDNDKWVKDYAIYMSLKSSNDNKSWIEWEYKYRICDEEALREYSYINEEDIEFWIFLQYEFYEEWKALKNYANKNGIEILGDIPIYVAYDSVDVWKNPSLFDLNQNLTMKSVAGCPPDYFSKTGQLWGNPIYNWDNIRKNGYIWWVERLRYAIKLYDIIRIDHFRGFESYYKIPAYEKTAINGEWKKGPGLELFDVLKCELGELKIIAEDLGLLTKEVIEMLKVSGYPGMKLFRFAFDINDYLGSYLPHNYTSNSVAYIGTHDNDTTMGWLKTEKKENLDFMKNYLDISSNDFCDITWKLIARVIGTVSNIAIIQMQDYLLLDNEARMNTPSTLGGNWRWRMSKKDINNKLAKKIFTLAKLYQRI